MFFHVFPYKKRRIKYTNYFSHYLQKLPATSTPVEIANETPTGPVNAVRPT